MENLDINNDVIDVLLIPSVGKSFGIGNFMRCLTISSRIGKAARPVFVIPKIPYYENHLHEKKIPWINFADLDENIKDFDVIVVDYQGPIRKFPFSERIFRFAPGVPVVALDYFYLDNELVDVIINLNDNCLADRPVGCKKPDYHLGLDFAIIRQDILELGNKRPVATDRIRKVLITFGGEDPTAWTLKALSWLEKHASNTLEVEVFLGPFFSQRENVISTVNRGTRHSYKVCTEFKAMKYSMLKNDLVFCGAGTTLMEAAFLGKPVVALPQQDAERRFMRDFERKGYLLPGAESAIINNEFYPIGKLFENRDERTTVIKNGLALVDGKGAERVAGIICQTAIENKQDKKQKTKKTGTEK